MESEKQLIERVIARDPRAEEEFVRRYEGLVLGLARGRFGCSETAAEEVRQEVMAKLWAAEHRALRAWRGNGRFTTYLAVIVTRLCLERRRSSSRRAEQALDPAELTRPDSDPGVEPALERRQLIGLVERARASLSPRDRLLLALRYADERSPREIAALLGLEPGAARKALYDALARLRARLRAESPELFAAGAVSPRRMTPTTGENG